MTDLPEPTSRRADAITAETNLWDVLKDFTDARVALGRSGTSLPTRDLLAFTQAHAAARDAVHEPADLGALRRTLEALGEPVLDARSLAPDRPTYLRRPDLGRTLHPDSAAHLRAQRPPGPRPPDVAVIIADGLSAAALTQAPPLLELLLPALRGAGLSTAPITLASQARVALGDGVALALGARLALILIGERPGLTSPDSLGAYLTYQPQPHTPDSKRNCVSNIRPAGLAARPAAWKLTHLITQALKRELSGVQLKDDSPELPAHFAPHALKPTP
ncbi:ethanolamine ammonia-lyase subunit EutC [Deinococcus sp. A31D244]|uniref:ethanolamine ammonia-lyase subunit EutC n=1 Tax=Deinococcus sp. A31D244 TaxID=3397675 RepID=UPI0039E0B22B